MGTKRSVSSSPHILQTMMYVAIISKLLISETPCKGHTQNTLYNGESLDTLTQVPIPSTQWQPVHGLIPTRLHLSPMLVIASQHTSMRPLSHSLPTLGSWLALFAWDLILLQAGDPELNPGPRPIRNQTCLLVIHKAGHLTPWKQRKTIKIILVLCETKPDWENGNCFA